MNLVSSVGTRAFIVVSWELHTRGERMLSEDIVDEMVVVRE